jgi:predicted nucleic acid-binding protein
VGEFELVLSSFVLTETRDVLERPRIRRKYVEVTDVRVAAYLKILARVADVVEVDSRDVPSVITADPPDNWILATALVGKATVIASGNRHLLDVGSYAQINILAPSAFLTMLVEGQ